MATTATIVSAVREGDQITVHLEIPDEIEGMSGQLVPATYAIVLSRRKEDGTVRNLNELRAELLAQLRARRSAERVELDLGTEIEVD